ncbi:MULTISPECIES: hypothetical protein [unclassified Sulfitobacter]|uniref:hypothetical protein n=1 Tax=unclassified Sulfitobacter TaxID=196795 RepID=UPI0007C37530|nr:MULTISPECIES: hypothetical protein [unclassified Sulfitobacter]KZX95340.1 hypothetical protein A3720_20990 [Sulfitobacter sp. HI0021]KZY03618.1 hypothetical protein A3722_20490 [Sulfitobacter sp. HI0027]KZZ02346.1 hypothetical protein A3747_15815 [Sulfitobacter sp. HI0076]
MNPIIDNTLSGVFSASEVSNLTGARPESIQNWVKRKLIVGHRKIEGGGSQGKHRRFTFFNVMEIAMAQTLMDMHMGAKEAFTAAAQFAHSSGGGDDFGLPKRDPALPFHHHYGDTIFGVAGERTFEELWESGSTRDTYGKLRQHLGSEHFLTVNASEVFNTVCARMQYHPFEVLDAAYPEDAKV